MCLYSHLIYNILISLEPCCVTAMWSVCYGLLQYHFEVMENIIVIDISM